MVDNYALFFQRIDEAQLSLRSKLSQNERRIAFIRQQLALASASHGQWNENVKTIDSALALYDGESKGYEYLAGLMESAHAMATAAQLRCALLESAIASLVSQETPLIQNINRLTASKGKLAKTQAMELAQRNLNNAVLNTGGGHSMAQAEPLDEMREVRRLIAEAEALAELKG